MHFLRVEVERRILEGETLIVYRGKLLRISQSWLSRHPGGSLSLLHFVGRDASDEIEAYHSEKALQLLRKFIIGTVELDENGFWVPFLPPVMSGWVRQDGKWLNEAAPIHISDAIPSEVFLVEKTDYAPSSSGPTSDTLSTSKSTLSLQTQARYSAAYRALHQRIIDQGLYQTPYVSGYGFEALTFLLLGGASGYSYHSGWTNLSAFFLGLLWHQLVFTCHDLGHMGVTHDWATDRLVSIFLADFIGGLSIGWWVENHNIHHLITNHPSHDPDIEHLPFFAISPKFFHGLWSTYYRRTMPFDAFAKTVIAIQHKLFYIVLMFGRFNLYFLSYPHVFQRLQQPNRFHGGKWAIRLETIGLMFFWGWFGSLLYGCGSWQKAVMYFVISHITTSPLHVQLVLSHYSMSTDDLGPTEAFPHRQLRTTTDVVCHPYLQFLHGGLHLQVTHHMFPRLPRHNLRKASKLVKEFAAEQGLKYAEFGFREGNRSVLGVLKGVADQIKIMTTVASAETREAIEKKVAGLE